MQNTSDSKVSTLKQRNAFDPTRRLKSARPPEEQVLLCSSGLFPVVRTFMIKSFLFNLPASLFNRPLLTEDHSSQLVDSVICKRSAQIDSKQKSAAEKHFALSGAIGGVIHQHF